MFDNDAAAREIHLVEQGEQGARVSANLAAKYYLELVNQGVPPDKATTLTGRWITAMTIGIAMERSGGEFFKDLVQWIKEGGDGDAGKFPS